MNMYKVSGQLTAFCVSWVSENLKFKNILSIERSKNKFLLKTNQGNYELTFKKIDKL